MLAVPLLATDSHFWEQERIRLIAICTRLTGNSMAAEDLAQETLYEAWRHRERLYDLSGVSAWLAAIARNICLRWRTQHAHDSAHQRLAGMPDEADALADPLDLEAIIERAETRQLLERALALLPTTARQALVEHCLLDVPYAAIAAQRGLAEATVKMQVHRGKLRLRHLLTTTFAAEVAACGLVDQSSAGEWQPTLLWCPRCGQRHLEGQWNFAVGTLRLRCRDCLGTTGGYMAYDAAPDLFHGVTSLKAGFNRVMRWVNAFYLPAIEQGGVSCACGRFLPLALCLPEAMPSVYQDLAPERYRQIRGLHLHCPACVGTSTMQLTNLALYLPEAWHFWSEHGRIRTLPEQEIAFQGRPALQLAFQPVIGAAQLDIIVARESYAILDVRQSASCYRMTDMTRAEEATA